MRAQLMIALLAASCAATQRPQTRDQLVDAGDAKIFVHVWGEDSGTPLVLIPGGPGVSSPSDSGRSRRFLICVGRRTARH